ncbi:Motile sperm domain-containing protein 2, partial [Tyrophagus putrescentiae]
MHSKIQEIRARFEAELQKKTSAGGHHQSFHPVDIERVKGEDWQIERYLLEANGNVDVAYSSLIRTLTWKASFGGGVHNSTEADFPSEFYHLYGVEKLNGSGDLSDLYGRPIFMESFKRQRRFAQLETAFQRLVAVSMETMDRITFGTGGNDEKEGILDVSLAKFRVELLNDHYPLLARRIILHNVPYLLKPVLKMIIATCLRPSIRQAVVFTSSTEQLQEYISLEVLPVELGGQRTRRSYPQGTVPLRKCYERFGLKEDFVEYYLKCNNDVKHNCNLKPAPLPVDPNNPGGSRPQ